MLSPLLQMLASVQPWQVERQLVASHSGSGGSQPIQVIRPLLHHEFSLRQIIRIVVTGAYPIMFAMSELPFDPIAILILRLVEPFGRRALARHGELEA
jgi:hypothetical protein